ncbi:hypothetical protein [Paenibacillus sp. y28]|uniref:hypothetical protein n=1 Tax=Paenibacillus sp. y28 TaxID=3129110 RepID=UPI00301A3B9C
MTTNELTNPSVFKLENQEVLVLYPVFMLSDLKRDESVKLIRQMVSDPMEISESDKLEQLILTKYHKKAIKLTSIVGIYTDDQHDEALLIVYRHFQTGQFMRRTLRFISSCEKNKFIDQVYSHMAHEFTCERVKNRVCPSIRKLLIMLVQTIVFGGILSWLAFYMNTMEDYSDRLPELFHALIVMIQLIGYIPFLMFTGGLLLLVTAALVKKLMNPSERLVIEKKQLWL